MAPFWDIEDERPVQYWWSDTHGPESAWQHRQTLIRVLSLDGQPLAQLGFDSATILVGKATVIRLQLAKIHRWCFKQAAAGLPASS